MSSGSGGKLLHYATFGDPKKEPLIFLSGFPDNELSGWGPVLELLKSKYYIITLCMPQNETISKTRRPWGYDFPELLEMINNTIESATTAESFNFVTHDWGAVLGYCYENKYPHRVKNLVTLDIGILKKLSPYQALVIAIYQIWFAVSYIISQLFGVTLGNISFFLFFGFAKLFPFLTPTPYDKPSRPRKDINVEMCYPYFYFWKGILTGRKLDANFPNCPLLYMYGTKKSILFHDSGFIKKIESTPKCRQRSFNTGHWIMLSEPQEVAKEIETFLVNNP